MKEILTVQDLKDYLNKLDSKFDSASIGIMKPSEDRIVDYEIASKESLGIILSPTKDKERQAVLAFCSREDSDKIEKIYKRHKDGE